MSICTFSAGNRWRTVVFVGAGSAECACVVRNQITSTITFFLTKKWDNLRFCDCLFHKLPLFLPLLHGLCSTVFWYPYDDDELFHAQSFGVKNCFKQDELFHARWIFAHKMYYCAQDELFINVHHKVVVVLVTVAQFWRTYALKKASTAVTRTPGATNHEITCKIWTTVSETTSCCQLTTPLLLLIQWSTQECLHQLTWTTKNDKSSTRGEQSRKAARHQILRADCTFSVYTVGS